MPERPQPQQEWVRRRMSLQKRQGTLPEMQLRRTLHASGFRYRVGMKVPGAPRRTIDVAFPRQRLAVFVDGCFWHGCPLHAVPPKNNGDWWAQKLAGNVARDLETTQLLRAAGWQVLRVWEHTPVEEAAATVAAILAASNRASSVQLG